MLCELCPLPIGKLAAGLQNVSFSLPASNNKPTSKATIFSLSCQLGWALAPHGTESFRGKVLGLRGVQVCITELCSSASPKVSLRNLKSWLEESISPHLSPIASFEDYTEGRDSKTSRRDWGKGASEWNKMDYEFENCQLSCIIQFRALAQCSATIQIFQLKWLYIQASKLTIK